MSTNRCKCLLDLGQGMIFKAVRSKISESAQQDQLQRSEVALLTKAKDMSITGQDHCQIHHLLHNELKEAADNKNIELISMEILSMIRKDLLPAFQISFNNKN